MKYSILVPYFDPEYKKTLLVTKLIKSIVQCTEEDYEFVIVKDGPSYVESHNIGLRNAKGDYIIVVNDDIEIRDKDWLKKLTSPDGITSYRLVPSPISGVYMPDAVCFGMSRQTFERLGLMDEDFKDGMNFEDSDYFVRARELGIPFFTQDVQITHAGSATTKAYLNQEQENEKVAINKKLFNSKWLVK
jgi:glycosyltransferase involved in cell wall biosynthesis